MNINLKVLIFILISNYSFSQNASLKALSPTRNYKEEQKIRNREIEFKKNQLEQVDKEYSEAERIYKEIKLLKEKSVDVMISRESQGCSGIRKFYGEKLEIIKNHAEKTSQTMIRLINSRSEMYDLINELKLFMCTEN